MTNYTQNGQPHGLKSLAQELRSYGRDGDTILAHINPQEAAMLKAAGGSGTINPVTGLPEFRFFKSVTRAIAAPFKAVNEVVKAVPVIGPAIDKGLVSLDKAVGNTIPGGWNTLAQTALAFTPLGLPAKVGLAALGGSGAFGKEGKFNFQKALLSGAMAYGMNQLTAGLQNAGSTTYDPSTGLTSATAQTPVTGSGDVFSGLAGSGGPPVEVAPELFKAAQSNIDPSFLEGMSAADVAGANVLPSVPNAPAPSFLQQTGANLSAAGQGIKNLSGFGTGTVSEAASKFAAPVTTAGMTALGVGTMGLASLDAQEKALSEQYQQGQVNDTEYNRQMSLIADGRRRAEEAVRANPYQFAVGGQVDDELGGDYSAMGMDQGNMQKGLFGKGYAAGGQIKGYAAGGMPDFGNGYNPFANLPTMSGPLGAARTQTTAQDQPSFAQSPYGPGPSSVFTTTEQDMRGGNRNGVSGGLSSIFNQSAPQISPSLNQNPNINTGGFAGPSPFYGGGGGFGGSGGGGGGPFPLEGQYGIVKMAAGGMPPRFLSGGGDGMSDSIQATINDKQPARLADGEFVIPADVVSGIGNGSSKAGAKRLYGMMDRVRKERTGSTKQAKAINPAKVMAA
jgi:hypothetical protein